MKGRLLKRIEISSKIELLQRWKRSFHGNVDQTELNKFERLGKEWWDATGANGVGPLHAMNPVRVQFVRESLASYHGKENESVLNQVKGLRFLDVGCGGGLLSESLARLGAQVTGIDPSERNIEVAKLHASLDPATTDIRYQSSTIQEMVKSDEKFDVICALEVIEHVPDPRDFLQSCFQCLSPTGSLFISTINKSQKSKWLAINIAEDLLRIVPPGTHDWNKFIAPENLKAIIEKDLKAGKLHSMKGIVINPKTFPRMLASCIIQWELSEDDLDVNYIAHFVKF